MSGIAIVLENADFSQKNIGQVNFITDVPVEAITITGEPSEGDLEVSLGIEYTPIGTSQRGVAWSVTSGDATINQSGVLKPDDWVDTEVVVSAISRFTPSVYASKTLSFSYEYLTPTWTLGFHNSSQGDYKELGEGRYYTILDGIDISQATAISCIDGFLFRVICYKGKPFGSTNKLSNTTTITSCVLSEIMPANTKYITINVSYDDVTGPSDGTIMSQEDVARLNEIVHITELNK